VTAVDKAFASLNGQAFYGLPPNAARVSLRRDPLAVPERIDPAAEALAPFRAGQTLRWRRVAPTHAPM
jgi:dihydroorotase